MSLIRDNKILLKKLVNSCSCNFKYFDKVTLSSKSSHVDMYDISNIITRTDSTGRLLFDGISCLYPNLVGDSVIS